MSNRNISQSIRSHWPLWAALAIGVILRVALWGKLPQVGLISDEAEYLASADWLALGRGFAWHTQYLWTRAPLYPLFLAGHLALFGRELTPIFLTQNALSLLNVALVYLLALQVLGNERRRAAGFAALLTALYLPLATYSQLLLSETLFLSLLLSAFVLLAHWSRQMNHRQMPQMPQMPQMRESTGQRKRFAEYSVLAAAGVLFGLATLTRGITLAFVPLVIGWMSLVVYRAERRRWGLVFLVPLTFCLTVAPWSVYAGRTYGGTVIVDTTGAFNLLLGARTAFDGGRNDEPVRSFVLALLDPTIPQAERERLLSERRSGDGSLIRAGSCLYEQGDPRIAAALAQPTTALRQADRQELMSAEALCLLRAAPGAFVTKSLVELIDLFQINYTGAERLSQGFTLGRLPNWYALALLLLDDTLYILVLPLAVLGWARLSMRHAKRNDAQPAARSLPPASLIGLWLLYNLAIAPLLFAINRFRVPLMPLLFILAAAVLLHPRATWALRRTRYEAACAVLAGLLWLIAATPYAYLEPRTPGADSRWASYFGPYPSTLSNTWLALTTRSGYLAEQELAAALKHGDVAQAQAALADPALPGYAATVGTALLEGLRGDPFGGLDRLAGSSVRPLEPWQTALVAGELFRQAGEIDAARREFGPELVDNANPVDWAWEWLAPPPPPDNRIAIADDNDLGYIRGFYLGRYDPDLAATVRWASGESQLRFPQAGNSNPQQLCLMLSGLGWPSDLSYPTLHVSANDSPIGTIPLDATLREHCLDLPQLEAGSDLIVTLRGPAFVPDALDLLRQQGPQVGQLRRLSYQLDWAELR